MAVAHIHVDLAQVQQPEWAFTAEHLHVLIDRGCIRCGAQAEPEPTDEERKRLFTEPDYQWFAPDGEYLCVGFGLMGGGYGPYVSCDRCGFFGKHDLGPEAE